MGVTVRFCSAIRRAMVTVIFLLSSGFAYAAATVPATNYTDGIREKIAAITAHTTVLQAKMQQNMTELTSGLQAKIMQAQLAELAPPLHIPLFSTSLLLNDRVYDHEIMGFKNVELGADANTLNLTVGLDAAIVGRAATMATHAWLDRKIFAQTEDYFLDKMILAINGNSQALEDSIKEIESQQLGFFKRSRNKSSLVTFLQHNTFQGLISLMRKDRAYLRKFFTLVAAQELALFGCNATINSGSHPGFTNMIKRAWLGSDNKPLDWYISASDIIGSFAYLFGRLPLAQWSGQHDFLIGMCLSGFSQQLFNSYPGAFAKRFLSVSYFLKQQDTFFKQHLRKALKADNVFAEFAGKIRAYQQKEISEELLRVYLKDLLFKNKQAAWSRLKNRTFLYFETGVFLCAACYRITPIVRQLVGW